ncbi:hypothetical protein Ccrd_023593 [Cynara cardunculus var. scolymus]|uniref:MHD domain-containing protein n=1 Tax=Cynara cardunculus var. scolymus TaxID=59895 RepID=A0A103XWJ2_CYNCS|nr:hypothetical protein Ccrd_023593 [Cynara cardunculus var. scolymus]
MAGAVSALFILDIKGRCLISRHYRGDISSVEAERFFTKLLEKEVFEYYFEELEEESLRDNFVVVYELLDEMMDFGYPQYTEATILSEFIKTDAYRLEVTQRPPMAVTNAVSWRNEGIFYKKNEVFLDVVESVNILINSNRQILRSEVEQQKENQLIWKTCVRLARFESDRTISFIPPDGSFDLMTYRLNTQVRHLKVIEKSAYQTLPWVRYITMAGEYEIRL